MTMHVEALHRDAYISSQDVTFVVHKILEVMACEDVYLGLSEC